MVRLVDAADRRWLLEHLRTVARENLQDDMELLFSRLRSNSDGQVTSEAGRQTGQLVPSGGTAGCEGELCGGNRESINSEHTHLDILL